MEILLKSVFDARTSKFGQSRSQIELLLNDNSEYFVVKRVQESDKLRFGIQVKKHQQALLGFMNPILVPAIHKVVSDLEYQMDLVSGKILGDFLSTASPEEMLEVIDKLLKYFQRIFEEKHSSQEAKKNCQEKLVRLGEAFHGDPSCEVFLSLTNKCIEVSNEIVFGESWNHGDLSFENILVTVNNHELFAIDFLDSPFESPEIDVGRILLDARFGWWGNGLHIKANANLNSTMLSDSIVDLIKPKFMGNMEIDFFIAFALLRIVPYTNNPVRLAFLKNAAWELIEVGKWQL